MRSYKTVFILAARRSGSTLLDNLIANHPAVVSLGEIDKLQAYALQNRRLYDPKRQELICSCGVAVPSCDFWRRVEAEIRRPLGTLRMQWPAGRRARNSLSPIKRRMLEARLGLLARRPGLIRSELVQRIVGSTKVAADNWSLFDAVHAVTGAECIIDASKAPFRFRTLWQCRRESVRAILLCRDYRAVAHSLTRRGHSLEDAIAQWRRSIGTFEEMVVDLPEKDVIRVVYEDLCRDPRTVVRGVHEFLGLPEARFETTRNLADMHHISGSPSKFDPNRQAVRMDDSYLGVFDEVQLAYLRQAARPYAVRWGYQ